MTDRVYWKDKVVVITGGSAGLGLELARTWLQSGSRVALVARDASRLDRAVQGLLESVGTEASAPSTPAPVAGFPADITDQAQVDALVWQVTNHFGQVDVLVNCAGKSSRGAVLETSPEEFADLLELNFLALVRCTRAFMPELLISRGHLVNIGSLAGKSASRFLGAYPASKFPVTAYSQQLRLEVAPQGVHILLACPGPIARPDAGVRYDDTNVPAAARKPGGGVKLKGLDPQHLAARILVACQRQQPELVVPAKAKLLFAISQLSPSWGDWLIKKMTS